MYLESGTLEASIELNDDENFTTNLLLVINADATISNIKLSFRVPFLYFIWRSIRQCRYLSPYSKSTKPLHFLPV